MVIKRIGTKSEGKINCKGWSDFFKGLVRIKGWGERKEKIQKWLSASNPICVRDKCCSIASGRRELPNIALKGSVLGRIAHHAPLEQRKGCPHVTYLPTSFFIYI